MTLTPSDAHQISERYVALAREAAIGGDPIAPENRYQYAEHYFRVINASRDGSPHEAVQPATPADVSRPEQESGDTDMERSPGWGDDRPGFR